ncbi:hypothetical protein GPJ56_006054 [Histomonas meleagridis]|uniref:uncharacterized protein n=1 Tax=Histomonas meleagridis TaxID=135588 RepID=UPI00355ABEB1|nr:hypothetical protein GPJ56_006054 [Histomonas meleagridis]KAH0807162.1 hypothetical protein GO595_000338 [Histomonas meleagridis]
MNSKKINSFLQSMEDSCDDYGKSVVEQRQRLRVVEAQYKELDKNAKRTTKFTKREPKTISHTVHTSRISRRKIKTTNEVQRKEIRPAPFPVRNYILPTQELKGPTRFYRSPTAQRVHEEKIEEERIFNQAASPNLLVSPSTRTRTQKLYLTLGTHRNSK